MTAGHSMRCGCICSKHKDARCPIETYPGKDWIGECAVEHTCMYKYIIILQILAYCNLFVLTISID